MNKLSSWESNKYYSIAKKGSEDLSHTGMVILNNYLNKAFVNSKVLDVGCGEGTRLANLINKNKKIRGYGIDISSMAIRLAKKRYPHLEFIQSDVEDVSLGIKNFDYIYSAYVLEHLKKPEKMIKECLKLLKSNGTLILIAPNYGSPNRSSPCYKGSRIYKLFFGYIKDLLRILSNKDKLNWNKVRPIFTKNKYEIDWDCQTEPYLGSLISYLKERGFKILEYSSCWKEESKNNSLLQRVIYFLSKLKLYPFNYWGPHFVLVARKID